MKTFDLLIIDTTHPHVGGYEPQTLQTRGMGGTEASVIRVAEGLASLGAHVGVVQHNREHLVQGTNAYYIPLSMIDELKTHNYVMLRGTQHIEKFPKAKKFSWHEDVPTSAMLHMRETFIDHNVTVIGASDWHKKAIQNLICDREKKDNPQVTYIYNPVPDEIFIPKGMGVKYHNNKLVWVASPHKGLGRAIETFNNLVEVSGNKDFRLHIFNPGYFPDGDTESQYVINHGSIPAHELWQHVSESLCVFYPTMFEETFGCIAAEANALHTPVLTSEIAALAETVSSSRQFVPKNDPKAAIDTVMKWHAGERPKVWGNENFRTSNVVMEWYKLLSGRKVIEDLSS